MATRSYNGRELVRNPNMIGSGSTTSESAWVGDSAYLWRVAQTSSGNNILTEFTEYNGRPCIKMAINSLTRTGGAVGQIYVGNLAEYAGATINVANLQTYGIKVKPNYTYKISVTYHLESIGADTGSTSFFAGATYYNTNGIRNTSTPSNAFSVSTATTDWTTSTGTFIQKQSGMNYIGIRIGFAASSDPTTNGNGVVYISNISLEEILPARTPTTSRNASSNRVATRDMGTALNFDGTLTNQVTSSQASVSTSKWATAFWVYVLPGVQHNFIYRGNGNSNYPRVFTASASDYRINFQYIITGQSSQSHTSTVRVSPFRWTHIACVIDTTISSARIYINGVDAGGGTPNGAAGDLVSSGANGFTVGRDTNLTVALKGTIDEVIQWRDYAPSATEILNLYLYGNIPGTPTRIYLFNEASGTTAIDTSGNGNDGTIAGATYTTDTPKRERIDV